MARGKTYANKLGGKTEENTYKNSVERKNLDFRKGAKNVYGATKRAEGARSAYVSREATNYSDGKSYTIGGGITHTARPYGPTMGVYIRNGKSLEEAQAQLDRLEKSGAAKRHPELMAAARTAVQNLRNYESLGAKVGSRSGSAG